MSDAAEHLPKAWRYSISEVTTFDCSFEEDVEVYAKFGCSGIGVWGFKMETIGWKQAKDLLLRSGLRATNCVPEVNSIMPYALSPTPEDPVQRVEAFLPNLERMANLNPETIVMITGPRGNRSLNEAMDLCLKGFERVGKVARDLGVTIALEPIHTSVAEDFSLLSDLPGAIRMLEQIDQPNFKILFDTWHLYDTPDIYALLAENIRVVGGVHISDWRANSRGWADRSFPGEGTIHLERLMSAIDKAGFEGFYDIEILSDNGQFAIAYPDSLWRLPATEIADRATMMFRNRSNDAFNQER